MGSSPSSSSSPLSECDSEGAECDPVSNGSLRYVDDGTWLANSPRLPLAEPGEDGRCRRVGRSDGLRIVGLALSGSAMVVNRFPPYTSEYEVVFTREQKFNDSGRIALLS